jgi:hypothetical protein
MRAFSNVVVVTANTLLIAIAAAPAQAAKVDVVVLKNGTRIVGEVKSMSKARLEVLLLPAQVPKEPARDLFLHSLKAPGVEIRFVDYHWQPVIFEAMASGKGDVPEAKRNWVFARVVLETRPLTLGTTRVSVGNYGLALWPNLDGKGMTVELRRVDMRDVFPNLNAMAPLPRGESIWKGPATFETASPLASRMDMTLAEADGKVVLTLLYGDRRLSLSFTR